MQALHIQHLFFAQAILTVLAALLLSHFCFGSSGGLTIVDMHADGNCLFRALSDQLFGDCGSRHAQIRSDICDFMEQNQEDFQVFLVLDDEDCEEDEDAKDFDGYLTSMREDGEWGGNLELVAAARLYR